MRAHTVPWLALRAFAERILALEATMNAGSSHWIARSILWLILGAFALWLLVSGVTAWAQARNINHGGLIPHHDYDDINLSWVDAPVYRLNKRVDAILRIAFACYLAALCIRALWESPAAFHVAPCASDTGCDASDGTLPKVPERIIMCGVQGNNRAKEEPFTMERHSR
jgi:hypothetical protein